MTHPTIDGFDLFKIFQSAIEDFDRSRLNLCPALVGVEVETSLLLLLERHQAEHSPIIHQLVCSFLRTICRRNDVSNVFRKHSVGFVRGSSLARLKITLIGGNVSIIDEFDPAALRIIIFYCSFFFDPDMS